MDLSRYKQAKTERSTFNNVHLAPDSGIGTAKAKVDHRTGLIALFLRVFVVILTRPILPRERVLLESREQTELEPVHLGATKADFRTYSVLSRSAHVHSFRLLLREQEKQI